MELNIPIKYKKDLNTAIDILKKEGCTSIYLFGSLVTGNIHDNSDIDLGVKGLAKEKFLSLYSKAYFDFDTKIDLVDFDHNKDLFLLLERLCEVVEVG